MNSSLKAVLLLGLVIALGVFIEIWAGPILVNFIFSPFRSEFLPIPSLDKAFLVSIIPAAAASLVLGATFVLDGVMDVFRELDDALCGNLDYED